MLADYKKEAAIGPILWLASRAVVVAVVLGAKFSAGQRDAAGYSTAIRGIIVGLDLATALNIIALWCSFWAHSQAKGYCGRRSDAMCREHSLPPLRHIHTLDKKPQAKRRLADQWRQQYGW